MRVSLQREDHRIDFHAGNADHRIHLTLAVTNTSNEPISPNSMMGSWSSIRMSDEQNTPRLEPMATTANVESWTIPPGKSLVATRKTQTPDEACETDSPHIEYVSSPADEDMENRVHHAPNIELPADADTELTAIGSVGLTDCAGEATLTFTPRTLSAPIEPDAEYDIVEDPTPTRTTPRLHSVAYTESEPDT